MNTTTMLKRATDRYLDEAREHGLTARGVGPIRDTFAALDAYAAARDRLRQRRRGQR